MTATSIFHDASSFRTRPMPTFPSLLCPMPHLSLRNFYLSVSVTKIMLSLCQQTHTGTRQHSVLNHQQTPQFLVPAHQRYKCQEHVLLIKTPIWNTHTTTRFTNCPRIIRCLEFDRSNHQRSTTSNRITTWGGLRFFPRRTKETGETLDRHSSS